MTSIVTTTKAIFEGGQNCFSKVVFGSDSELVLLLTASVDRIKKTKTLDRPAELIQGTPTPPWICTVIVAWLWMCVSPQLGATPPWICSARLYLAALSRAAAVDSVCLRRRLHLVALPRTAATSCTPPLYEASA